MSQEKFQKKLSIVEKNFLKYYTNVGQSSNIALNCRPVYAFSMFMTDYFIVFPEGDTQEIRGRLVLNALVDVNGSPVNLPLPTNKMVVFKVVKIKSNEYKGGVETFHYLEQLSAQELLEYVS